MSRQELADAVNRFLSRPVDDKYIGKLERGEIRWPSRQHRSALRAVLGALRDDELGFYVNRNQRSMASAPVPSMSPESEYLAGVLAGIILARVGLGCRCAGNGGTVPIVAMSR